MGPEKLEAHLHEQGNREPVALVRLQRIDMLRFTTDFAHFECGGLQELCEVSGTELKFGGAALLLRSSLLRDMVYSV